MAFVSPSVTDDDRRRVAGAGLCAGCTHLQVLRSRSSTFVRCARHDVDPSFVKYPVLPVLRCAGYEPPGAAAGATPDSGT